MSFFPLCFFLVYLTKHERALPRELLGLAIPAFELTSWTRRLISLLESSRMLMSVGFSFLHRHMLHQSSFYPYGLPKKILTDVRYQRFQNHFSSLQHRVCLIIIAPMTMRAGLLHAPRRWFESLLLYSSSINFQSSASASLTHRLSFDRFSNG